MEGFCLCISSLEYDHSLYHDSIAHYDVGSHDRYLPKIGRGHRPAVVALRSWDYLGRRNRSSNQMGKNDWPGASFTSVR